jgi:hypothetical protein
MVFYLVNGDDKYKSCADIWMDKYKKMPTFREIINGCKKVLELLLKN